MSEPKWTPGPWELRDTHPGKDVFSRDGVYIATVGHAGTVQQRPNAGIIITAPCMYRQLSKCLDVIVAMAVLLPAAEGLEKIERETHEVLAAARGEQP